MAITSTLGHWIHTWTYHNSKTTVVGLGGPIEDLFDYEVTRAQGLCITCQER